MTFTIGICDDLPEEIDILSKFIEKYSSSDHYETIKANQPREFLHALKNTKPDIVFLDIDMGEINGIQLGDMLRTLYPDVIIVYISAYENYALEAFRVRAFHYLLKPITRDQFFVVMDEALASIRRSLTPRPEISFGVKIKGETIRLLYRDIFYFEKIGHRIKIHTTTQDVYFYDKLSSLTDLLDPSCFFQCHAGYIVNADKIRVFRDRKLILDNGFELPVSRTYLDQVKDKLSAMLFEKD